MLRCFSDGVADVDAVKSKLLRQCLTPADAGGRFPRMEQVLAMAFAEFLPSFNEFP